MPSEIVRQPPQALEKSDLNPMALISQAIEKGMSGEQLNGLLEFAKNLKAEAAKEAYFQAFKAFKDSAPKIIKDSKIVHEKNGSSTLIGMYAKLEQVCDKLIPALGKVGLTHRWDSQVNGPAITVTCFLRHQDGYEERGATLTAGPDTGGAKNAVQAVASTVSYLQRYTLLMSCGLAAEGVDTDAEPSTDPQDLLDESVAADFLAAIEASTTVDELQANYFAARDAAKADPLATKTFAEAKNRMYKKLAKGGH